MPNKDRLLVLLHTLQNNSDDETWLTTQDLRSALEKEGFECSIRTLRRDVQSLRNCGYDIAVQETEGILSYIDNVNFNKKEYLGQDYLNFKKYIGAARYPQHVDYLNNDFAPDLLKFMKAKIGSKKNASYLGFLKAINEEDLPSFDEQQEKFIRYVSEMLPIVRPYEYLMIQSLLEHAWKCSLEEVRSHVETNMIYYRQEVFDHALIFMIRYGFFDVVEGNLILKDVRTGVEFDEYMRDLLEYGLGKYDVDFYEVKPDELFHLWKSYEKSQVQQLLLNNPNNIMKGTQIINGVVYIYVTVIKDNNISEKLNYADGYIDLKTFQWETVANVTEKELSNLKNSSMAQVFVRKMDNEDGITLPFTYIGVGKMEYIEGSKKANGAHLFRIAMDVPAPEDVYFDFKLPE